MTVVHYSLQPKVQGRPTKNDEAQLPKQVFKVGFQSKFTTVEEFSRAVCEEGFLWSGTIYKKGERHGSNFQLSDLYALDIDNKVDGKPLDKMTTPEDVLKHHPLKEGICLIYHSGSSTREHPRFRVVFRLPKVIRDRREFLLFSHKFWAVSASRFEGLDSTKDEARLWYGSFSGAFHIDEEAKLDFDKLEQLFRSLPKEVQQQAEGDAIFRVASREELIQRGLLRRARPVAPAGQLSAAAAALW